MVPRKDDLVIKITKILQDALFFPSQEALDGIKRLKKSLPLGLSLWGREKASDDFRTQALNLIDAWLCQFFPEIADTEFCQCGSPDCAGLRLIDGLAGLGPKEGKNPPFHTSKTARKPPSGGLWVGLNGS